MQKSQGAHPNLNSRGTLRRATYLTDLGRFYHDQAKLLQRGAGLSVPNTSHYEIRVLDEDSAEGESSYRIDIDQTQVDDVCRKVQASLTRMGVEGGKSPVPSILEAIWDITSLVPINWQRRSHEDIHSSAEGLPPSLVTKAEADAKSRVGYDDLRLSYWRIIYDNLI